ncbi:Homeobox protein MIXL1, partial [Calypte anna]
SQRRKRTSFTAAQLETLELVFQDTMSPDIYLREKLADATQIPESRIQVRSAGRTAPPRAAPGL